VAPAKSASKSKRSAAAAPKEKKSTAPKEVMTLERPSSLQVRPCSLITFLYRPERP
jgi:hypothetical protein